MAEEGADKSKDIIQLSLVSQDGSAPLDFRVKRTTKVEKIIKAYATQKGVNESALRLFHQGIRLKPNGTIEDYGDLADGDQIDVVLEQVGGF